jgi:hypothetical protein
VVANRALDVLLKRANILLNRADPIVTVMGSPTLNWQHPDVLKTLNVIIAIDPDEIHKSVRENNVEVLEFTKYLNTTSLSTLKKRVPIMSGLRSALLRKLCVG